MTYVEIFWSYLVADCDHRAFVLKAVGIEHVVAQSDARFILLVPEQFAERAIEQLRSYDEESRPKPPPPPLQLHRHAWIGSLVYAFLMLAIAYCAGANIGSQNWYEAGVLRHSAIAGSELWRIVTALTLHADVGHILGNLAFGIPYGFFAAQLLGGGRAWLSILVAAACGNLFDSALMDARQSSIGASTAVFAMLGIVGAYAWRRGQSRFNRWAHRAAPLIAAVALLAITGVGDESTDIVAHLAGFGFGILTGTVQAHLRSKHLDRMSMQVLAGAVALMSVFGAWWWAHVAT
ncbi:MAG TPA: rhomboid family intramembrane serine protease [Steroidobacteraceae bacterium]|nr:rhomboid family intramembrane serine protease [Steroidobacteraceae bacterium]